MMWRTQFGLLFFSVNLLPSLACIANHMLCPSEKLALSEESLDIASVQLLQKAAWPKHATEVAHVSQNTAREWTGTAEAPSFTYQCHKLLLGGSRIFSFCVCLLLSLCFFIGLGSCIESKPSFINCIVFVCPCGLTLCTCLAAIVWWGLHGRLEFVHIPKNAGSNVESAGLNGRIHWGKISLAFIGSQSMPDGSSCSLYHVPPALLNGIDRFANAETFCMTRHPFERAVSEYSYLLSQNWGRTYARSYNNGLYDFPKCTKRGLNNYVQKTMHLFRSGFKYIDDCHHVPQVEYIWDYTGQQLCTHIIRLDDLPEAFNSLMRSRGYQVQLTQERDDKFCPNLSVDFLTNDSKSMLLEIYADDFRLLNYSLSI